MASRNTKLFLGMFIPLSILFSIIFVPLFSSLQLENPIFLGIGAALLIGVISGGILVIND